VTSYDEGRDRVVNDFEDEWFVTDVTMYYHGNEASPDGDGHEAIIHMEFVCCLD
jgi:hypothetical protein